MNPHPRGSTLFARVAAGAALLAFCVVVLGAWVRLTHAGLGCPDWPGCYGQLTVPAEAQEAHLAQYPDRPLESGKAWREMVHRYFAGLLGLLVLGLAVLAVRRRHEPGQPLALPLFLVALIVFQALLGMWTVTLLLKPVVVVAHLLGGMATLALLWWLALGSGGGGARQPPERRWLQRLAALGLALLVVQIALGGWTSSNYAALACPDFPTCQGRWWPEADFADGFVLWRGLGVDYEGGVLDNPARVAVHLTHRLGAVAVTVVLGMLVLAAILRGRPGTRRAALLVGVALAAQIALGIGVVKLGLPLWVAVAHNATAALLLLSMVTLNNRVRALH